MNCPAVFKQIRKKAFYEREELQITESYPQNLSSGQVDARIHQLMVDQGEFKGNAFEV